MTTIYRNYTIARVGDKFVAQSEDDQCLMVSGQQHRLHTAIDDLWTSLDRGVEPAWFSSNSAIDLDVFGPESAPSSSDPPLASPPKDYKVSYWTFGLSALFVSAPLTYLMEVSELFPRRVDVFLSIGVCAVAVGLGRNYALLATAIIAVVFNFFAMEPFLAFATPTWSEVVYLSCNLALATMIPALIDWRESRRDASSPRRIRDT